MIDTPYPDCKVQVERMDGAVLLQVSATRAIALRALSETLSLWNPNDGTPRIKVESWPA